ncbi:hypothetical protein [Mobilicoccus pelagius]|uniref:Uncharacterized protein n=1 Tax=Mobilicoccus pelagius NBRC 104925 TaxID=1089455 RepID=H5UUB4_9MICO|nr:hypothetical protein [Mobilicoccus pelagius]GAB49322.1 hypothetical protein MOPEL_113_00020 [Mobilicoccus pelagius NBRC 104925]
MTTILDALTAAGPWPTAALGGLASIIGGSLGGWISTLLTNTAAKRRQKNDHEHAQALAAERIHADTVAALRAQRATLYVDVYNGLRDYADYTAHDLNDAEESIPITAKDRSRNSLSRRARGWEADLHDRATAALDTYDGLRARVELLAPHPVRSTYADLRQPLQRWVHTTEYIALVSASQPTEADDDEHGTWRNTWHLYVTFERGRGATYRDTLDTLARHMREDMASPTLDT